MVFRDARYKKGSLTQRPLRSMKTDQCYQLLAVDLPMKNFIQKQYIGTDTAVAKGREPRLYQGRTIIVVIEPHRAARCPHGKPKELVLDPFN